MKIVLLLIFLLIWWPNVHEGFSTGKDYSAGRLSVKEPRRDDNEIPVLCYHNIKRDSKQEDLLRISEQNFEDQIRYLYNSGYHTILPGQLYRYLTTGAELPSKPILLSFDDSHEEDYSIAKPVLDKYKFKGVFFIMTVCIDKPHYLSAVQIRELANEGHAIENHSWDHPNMTELKEKDWRQQIDRPRLELERLTGKQVNFFAYPYGAWNRLAVLELKKRNIEAAFQLSGKLSSDEPLYTIRRLMVSGLWTPAELEGEIRKTFRGVH